MRLSKKEFIDKYALVFAPNAFEKIREDSFQEFAVDIADLTAPDPVVEVSAEQLRGLVAGLALTEFQLYRIIDRSDANNLSLPSVRVRAYSPSALASADAYEEAAGGNLIPVLYNLANDTTTPRESAGIQPWQAGAYPAGRIVSTANTDKEQVLFYAKQAIGNSTSAPGTFANSGQYWGRVALTPAEVDAAIKKLVVVFQKFEKTDDHPELLTQRATDEYLLAEIKALKETVKNMGGQTIPGKPDDARVDDVSDTFSAKLVPGFPALVEYEGFGFPGEAGIVPLSSDNAYVQGGYIYLKGLAGPIGIGEVGFRVAASGSRPSGPFATNPVSFTGSVVITPPTPIIYTATLQSYTARCGSDKPGTGTDVTRTNSTETSTVSQADANAKALAVATQDAKNAITCQVAPTVYDNTISAGQTVKGVTLGAQQGATLEFNNATGSDNSPATMALWLNNAQVASVPYENYYTGKPFRFALNGQKYTKNFAAGRVDL
ncbi:DUF5977 domain-containing protein [Hymenobacter norwichensis]|uniref:DUF5977 domain-containing protein n=1 Tax=Hymenobacter norwichensis TaxID=223903 RepID=UPI0003B67079|nr:hypothetical protein [Hymenobacter norwichensis]